MGDIGDILETCMIFDQKLSGTESTKDRADIILEHIRLVEEKLKVKCPQFEPGIDTDFLVFC
jgi:hypothetical protein